MGMGKKERVHNAEAEGEARSKPSLKRFFKTYLHSFWPDNYHQFCERRLGSSASYLLTLLIIAFAFTSVLFLVDIAGIQDQLDSEINKIDKLNVDINFTLHQPIALPDHNVIVMEDRNYTDENVLINGDGIHRKSLACMVLGRLCLFNRPKSIEFKDLEDKKYLLGLIKDTLYLLLPVFLFSYFVLYVLKYAVLIMLFATLGYLASLGLKLRFPFIKSLNAAVYSSTIMITLDVVKVDFIEYYFVPIILYLVCFSLVIMLVSEKKKGIF